MAVILELNEWNEFRFFGVFWFFFFPLNYNEACVSCLDLFVFFWVGIYDIEELSCILTRAESGFSDFLMY